MTTHRPAARRFAVLLTVVAVAVSACGKDDKKAATDTTSVTDASGLVKLDTVKAGSLTACSDIPYAPFEFEQEGKVVGVDADIVRAVAGRLGLTAEFRDVDFDGIFAALKARQCDIVASAVSITDERRKTLDFSDGYFEINQSLLVRSGDERTYPDLAALKGRTIGVQSSTTGADYARANAPGVTIREYTGADEMFTALVARQIDGIVQDFPVNAYHAKTTGQTVVATTFTEVGKEQYGLVIPKGDTAMKDAVDGALSEIRADDTYPTILRQYLGDTAGQD